MSIVCSRYSNVRHFWCPAFFIRLWPWQDRRTQWRIFGHVILEKNMVWISYPVKLFLQNARFILCDCMHLADGLSFSYLKQIVWNGIWMTRCVGSGSTVLVASLAQTFVCLDAQTFYWTLKIKEILVTKWF